MNAYHENRQYKDSLFRIVFGENRENALALYNAINGTDYTNTEDLIITTLDDAVYIGIRNDVGFLFNDMLNLYEHQSTFNPNIPFRGLGYFADSYKILLADDIAFKPRIYDSAQLRIPTPKFYVFYNGTKDAPERVDLRLSDAYSGDGDLEVIAHMININRGYSMDLMNLCKPLSDYSEFIHRVRECVAQGMSKEAAAESAIDSCIRDGIMEDLLRKERAKVSNALYSALTEEEIEILRNIQLERATEQGMKQGIEQGMKQGIEQGEDRMGRLVDCLIKNGRQDEISRAVSNFEYRKQLYIELNIK